ncbi:hypothetical protein [Streptomyces sp. TLI_171]|nr:hypothetical protein [Streptomyces sp. TLI_171]RKE17283.1 hypothetical protein BX266_0539 [Streptomyces sp. TLI_171]
MAVHPALGRGAAEPVLARRALPDPVPETGPADPKTNPAAPKGDPA